MFSTIISLLYLSLGFTCAAPYSRRANYVIKERRDLPDGWVEAGQPNRSEPIDLRIGLKQITEGAVEHHLHEISDPLHPRYGQHLTKQELHDLVRPSQESIVNVEAWLSDHGLTNYEYNSAKNWISASITIDQVEHMLDAVYALYEHYDGTILPRTMEWSLPQHLIDHVEVIQPTTLFSRNNRIVSAADRFSSDELIRSTKEPTHESKGTQERSNVCSTIIALCKIANTVRLGRELMIIILSARAVSANEYSRRRRTNILQG
jgi:tripeptidyl-peptidase-1